MRDGGGVGGAIDRWEEGMKGKPWSVCKINANF